MQDVAEETNDDLNLFNDRSPDLMTVRRLISDLNETELFSCLSEIHRHLCVWQKF